MPNKFGEQQGFDVSHFSKSPIIQQKLILECVLHSGNWSAFEPVNQLISLIAKAFNKTRLETLAIRSKIVVVFSDDQLVRTLNRNFRKIDKSTNVLSFPLANKVTDVDNTYQIGDIILACETII